MINDGDVEFLSGKLVANGNESCHEGLPLRIVQERCILQEQSQALAVSAWDASQNRDVAEMLSGNRR